MKTMMISVTMFAVAGLAMPIYASETNPPDSRMDPSSNRESLPACFQNADEIVKRFQEIVDKAEKNLPISEADQKFALGFVDWLIQEMEETSLAEFRPTWVADQVDEDIQAGKISAQDREETIRIRLDQVRETYQSMIDRNKKIREVIANRDSTQKP